MKRRQTKSDTAKSRSLAIFEYILLGICLSVIALRATLTESPTIQSLVATGNFNEAVYSSCLAAVLLFCFVLWFVWNFLEGRLSYRRSGVEIGLCVFLVGSLIAGLVAPDKRLAISSVATLVGPILMALLLVQLLDSASKVKLVLAVVAALGLVNAQRSAEQFLSSNRETIAEYEKNRETQLMLHGIEPNSFQQFMFEHRIYSGGVTGFFLTRNSLASFLLLACFAVAALLVDQVRKRSGESKPIPILSCSVVAAVLLLNFAATNSKGAFIGLFFAVVMLIVWIRFGKWVKSHRRGFFLACLLLAAIAAVVVGSYGLRHGRLPGGNSMLVRWQYWRASAAMYADHPLTGVGPGAFADYYTHYKPAAALEAVTDPHNFPLSILTQYGPLGLVGFLAMILGALWKGLSVESDEGSEYIGIFRAPAIVFAFAISAVMLIIRPLTLTLPEGMTTEEKQAGIVILYLMPVFIFLIGLLLAGLGQRSVKKGGRASLTGGFLFAAVIGFLIHNLMDFAIFEPGVLTVFWALMACLVATACNRNPERSNITVRISPVVRVLSIGAGVVAIAVYLHYALIPVVRSTALIQKANTAVSVGRFDLADDLLDSASSADELSPVAAALDGRMHVYSFELDQKRNPELLLAAEEAFILAISRNAAEFKNYERLANVYVMLSETDLPSEGASWLQKAFDSAWGAVERYPGCARLRVKLARIAEQQGEIEIAIEQYEKAVEIEDSYRMQFRTIYPERVDVVSRVGEDKYHFAKDRLEALRGE